MLIRDILTGCVIQEKMLYLSVKFIEMLFRGGLLLFTTSPLELAAAAG